MNIELEAWKASYDEQGYILVRDAVKEIPQFEKLLDGSEEKFFEKDDVTLRSVYGFHKNPLFLKWLSESSLIKQIVVSLLGEEVYLHQCKVNIKNRDESSVWPFHRDYPFWKVFDHFPKNDFLNVVVYLDDVFEGSGELKLIPCSHMEFLDREAMDELTDYSLEGSASSDLLFSFSEDEITYFKKKFGVFKTIAQKGSVLLFDPNLIHGSDRSVLDFSRKILILTFNKCMNRPSEISQRPNYLCNSDNTPLKW
ncbi:MAG: phytanoyl-CoA dioxygenase family protein [Cryomorphaceae bacterium]|nr:phytanoyl-CoA dioxygenase family protein [Cryomorphaceae bacterium]